ncbi:hypothetical protein C8R44DRAFT_991801 [Mycena epipterygia]|nr:hypothetical protein C8R44DRAFT_991801 [Mycena epipterygia]
MVSYSHPPPDIVAVAGLRTVNVNGMACGSQGGLGVSRSTSLRTRECEEDGKRGAEKQTKGSMRPPDVPLDSWPRVLVLFELVFRRIASSHRPFPFVLCIIIFPLPVPLVVLMLVMRESVSNPPDPERVFARGIRPCGPLPAGGINGQRSLRSRTMRYSAWIFDVRLRIAIGSSV